MLKKTTIVAVALSILMLALLPGAVFAHFLGHSAVDGREIRYGDSTQYDDARNWAINQWNALGKVNIAPDDAWSFEDLTWKDTNQCYVTWDGQYTHYAGNTWTDVIELNVCYFKNYGDFTKRAVATHEQGHALGLAHSILGQVLWSPVQDSNVNTPQAHDRQDYFALWP